MIDDDESIRYAVDAGLDFLGDYDVHFSEDGLKGIESMISFSPDLVLIDLVLPSASGIDVLEAIRNNREIKRPKLVVLMTGHPNPVKVKLMTDIGIDKILPKLFTLDDLERVLPDT